MLLETCTSSGQGFGQALPVSLVRDGSVQITMCLLALPRKTFEVKPLTLQSRSALYDTSCSEASLKERRLARNLLDSGQFSVFFRYYHASLCPTLCRTLTLSSARTKRARRSKSPPTLLWWQSGGVRNTWACRMSKTCALQGSLPCRI